MTRFSALAELQPPLSPQDDGGKVYDSLEEWEKDSEVELAKSARLYELLQEDESSPTERPVTPTVGSVSNIKPSPKI